MTRSPFGRLAVLALLLLSAGLVHAQAWVQSVRYQQTAYFLFDGRIERYDLQNQVWLGSVALPAAGAKSIVASDRGVHVAIGTNIHRFDVDLGNRTLLTSTSQPVVHLLLDGSMLIATQSGAGITALFHPLDGGTPVQSNVASNTWDLLGPASVTPIGNKLFGRSSVRGPDDIVQVTYNPAGGLLAVTDSPYAGGALPSATRTYVMPGETRVVDNAGIVYATSNLNYVGSFGGPFTDIAFRDDQFSVVLRDNRLSLHDTAYRQTTVAPLSAAATSVHLSADAAFAFIPEATARGVRAERVAFSAFATEVPRAAVSPVGLNYTPDQILMDRDGVVLLYSAAHRTVFRWSTASRAYLEGIGLNTAPTHITYSPAEHALYLGSATGAIARVGAVPGSATTAFANVPTPVRGLVATDSHLLAVHYMGSSSFHRTFDRNGAQVDAVSRNTQSRGYEYSPGNRKVYWFHDSSSGGILHNAVIGTNGILGPDIETRYTKPFNSDTLPIRANAAGSKVAIARGVIFGGSPLAVEYETDRTSSDLGWVGETLHTIEPRSGNQTTWNRWASDWNVERARVFEGTPLRLLPDANLPVVVTLENGTPRFHLLDANGDVVFDSVPGQRPGIVAQPEDTRTDYGRSASFRVLVSGSEPLTYRWTKNGVTIPGETSADLVLENCGSGDAAIYQVTVTGVSTVTSATARLGVGPVRNLAPYTVGNLLACTTDKLYEARTNGQIVRTTQVPNPYNGGFSNHLQDVVMDRLGRIHVIHTPAEGGNTPDTVSTLDPEFATWSHVKLYSTFAANVWELDLSIAGDILVTNRLVAMDVITRRVKRLPRIYDSFDRPNLTGGLDGFAYGGDTEGKVTRFDPRTWTLLQTSVDDPTGGHNGASAAANGTIYSSTYNRRLSRMAPGTSGQAAYLNLPAGTEINQFDFNLSRSGQIAIASPNGVILSSTQFQSSSLIKLQGVTTTTYVGWVEAPVIPAPSFAATPPATTLEDMPFVFDPLPGHVDPDANLTLVLEAGPPWLSLNAGRQLAGTPRAEHIGTTTVRIRATDGFGVSTPLVFTLRVVEVNDTPFATNLELTRPEDTPPFETALGPRFSDEETADGDLIYQLLSHSDPAIAAATIEAGNLRISPVKDAYGSAVLIVRATDAGGLTADSEILLNLTPVNDPPVFSSDVPDITADPTGAPLGRDLTPFVFDADPGDSLVWSLGAVTVPGLYSQLAIDPVSGKLDIVFAPYVSGTSDVTVTATDGSGTSASFTFQVTLPELPLPQVAVTAAISINRQTGLFEQGVTVTNSAQRDIAGFDLTISGLPAGVTVNNATGSTATSWIIQHRRVMAPGASVTFTIEYHAAARGTAFDPQLDVALVTIPESPAAARQEGLAVTRCELLEDGSLLIEFASTPRKAYEIQYSGDGSHWVKSPVPVTAAANRVQWIDRGPPRTESHPASKSARFYRVLELGNAP